MWFKIAVPDCGLLSETIKQLGFSFPDTLSLRRKGGVTNEWQTMTVNGDTGDDY